MYEIMLHETRNKGWTARIQGRGPTGEEFTAHTHEYRAPFDYNSREYVLREAEAIIFCNRRFGALENAWDEAREYLKAYISQGTHLVRRLPTILNRNTLDDEEVHKALMEAVEGNARAATIVAILLLEVKPAARRDINEQARRML